MKNFIYYIATLLLSVPFLTSGMEPTPASRGVAAAEITKPSEKPLSVTLPDGSTVKVIVSEGVPSIIKQKADGSLLEKFNLPSRWKIYSIAVTKENKIVLGGMLGRHNFEARLNSDLTPDRTFARWNEWVRLSPPTMPG